MRPADPAEAYERLDGILAREEFNETYVSPLEWIVRAFTWFTEWFSAMPLWAQILIIALLVLILVAILAHVTYTMVRVWRTAGDSERLPEPESVRSVKDLPAARTLLAQAREALGRGRTADALRLYYLAVLSGLREKGRIPLSTALTGREILGRTSPPLAGLGEATTLFETTVYGGRIPDDRDVQVVRRLAEEVR